MTLLYLPITKGEIIKVSLATSSVNTIVLNSKTTKAKVKQRYLFKRDNHHTIVKGIEIVSLHK